MIDVSRQLFRSSVALLLVISMAGASNAALVYELAFDQTVYTASPGALTTVNVFLRETATDGEELRLTSPNDDGLFTVGFQIDYGTSTSGNGSFLPDELNSTRVTFNPALDDTGIRERSDTGSNIRIFGGTTDTDTGVKVISAGNIAELAIASIQFTSSSVPGDVTTLNLLDLDSGANTSFVDLFSPDDINALSFGSASIQVVAVPEPSSMAFAATLCAGLAATTRRRRVVFSREAEHVEGE